MTDTFSKRHGLTPNPEPTIRHDAPEAVRATLLHAAGQFDIGAHELRSLVCGVLRRLPDRDNWSTGNVWREAEGLIENCDWPKVYDSAEAMYRHIDHGDARQFDEAQKAKEFEKDLNATFQEHGIGWQMKNGLIEIRGSAEFEQAFSSAEAGLKRSGREVAAKELSEARRALSRRPDPDTSGAISHSMSAVESLTRDLLGDNKATFGQLVPKLGLQRPLDDAADRLWGYASQYGRHRAEDKTPTPAEAEFVTFVCAAFVTLINK